MSCTELVKITTVTNTCEFPCESTWTLVNAFYGALLATRTRTSRPIAKRHTHWSKGRYLTVKVCRIYYFVKRNATRVNGFQRESKRLINYTARDHIGQPV